MVAVKATRVVVQVLREAGPRAGATRQSAEVGATGGHASTQAAKATRLSLQVLAHVATVGAATRQSLEVGATGGHASSQGVQATRVVGQVLSAVLVQGSATRQTLEVGATGGHASSQAAKATRALGQALGRLKALPVIALSQPPNLDVFLHNWARAVEMETSYLTDITTAATTAAEERRGLVPRPSRKMRVRWTKNTTAELDRLLVFLRRLTEERMAVPLYQDYTPLLADAIFTDTRIFLDTTRGRFHTGGRVAIVELDYALHFTGTVIFRIISAMQSDYIDLDSTLGQAVAAVNGRTWIVLPMIDVEQSLRVETRFKNGILTDIELRAEEVLGPSALPPWAADIPPGVDSFEGYPIFNDMPDWSDDLRGGYDHPGEVTEMGRYRSVYLAGDRPRYVLEVPLRGDRDLGIKTIKFLDSRRGRLRSWWQIDEEFIWTVQSFQVSGDFVDVLPLGNFDDFADRLSRIGIEMANGTRYVRHVVSVQDLPGGWRVTVTPQLPTGLSAADVVHFARARFVRNDSDSFTERWDSDGNFSTEFHTIEVLDEAEAPIQ